MLHHLERVSFAARTLEQLPEPAGKAGELQLLILNLPCLSSITILRRGLLIFPRPQVSFSTASEESRPIAILTVIRTWLIRRCWFGSACPAESEREDR